VEEYIALLSQNVLFAETESATYPLQPGRIIRLYDVPVAAGSGSFLDSEAYTDFKVDETVPQEADFAVKVSGDSMTPRFVDRQIVFIKAQPVLEIGDIGIFELDGDAYIKKLGQGELLSLNTLYKPIPIHDYNSFHIFGKVVG
jgi:SOS-response transcriptional repressor LexA